MKYLVSLKHTRKNDPFITLWGPNSAGYVWSTKRAGQYDELKKGYHDSDDTLPIDTEIIDRMASMVTYEGELKSMVPQNRYTLKELGLKRTTKGLVKV